MDNSETIASGTSLGLETSLSDLRNSLKGRILLPADEPYEKARVVWNSMINKKPQLIVQCQTKEDVVAAIKYARAKQLQVSVRGGGHNVAGNAISEGGLMIDLSPMKDIQIDIAGLTARVEPGVIWKELDKATIAHGLATNGGTVSDTGVAGLTLGGGVGWLMGKHGTTGDNLLEAEMVLASGESLVVNAENNPDLFWAIRGGGGNFGIVTSFLFKLHKVETTVKAGMILHPMEAAKDMFRFFGDHVRKAPDELMSYSGFIVTPDGHPVAMMLPAWMGPLDEADRWLDPLRKFGTPLADMVSEMPYTGLQSIIDQAAPWGLRRYWKSGNFENLSDELIDIVMKNLETRPSPYTPVLFFHHRGAGASLPLESTAFPHRGDLWGGDIISQWTDAADDEKNVGWTRKFWKEIEPLSRGVYVNHLDSDDGNDRVKNAYGPNYEKLAVIKKKYDPENFFRLNNNILPA
jgi:FAD/FMN-containing dehydrogenase